MTSQTIIVSNRTGIHARPAALFLSTASQFKSEISIEKNGKKGNAKSLLSLLALGIKQDSEITIIATGEDENEALSELVKLVETKFGEA